MLNGEEQRETLRILRSREGARALFDAACWAKNGEEAQKYRDMLHELLDQELDLSSSCCARVINTLGPTST